MIGNPHIAWDLARVAFVGEHCIEQSAAGRRELRQCLGRSLARDAGFVVAVKLTRAKCIVGDKQRLAGTQVAAPVVPVDRDLLFVAGLRQMSVTDCHWFVPGWNIRVHGWPVWLQTSAPVAL